MNYGILCSLFFCRHDEPLNDSNPDNTNNVFLTQNHSLSDSGSNASSTGVTKLPQIIATNST